MSKKTAWWAALMLVGMAAAPAQTDPGLSTKPAGLTLTGEKIAPEEKPVDLSRPEMRQVEELSTSLVSDYSEAAARGEAWAQTKLGKIYVASDDDLRRQEGVELLRYAAEQKDAEALYVLATLSASGIGVDQSDIDAFAQMKRAAELGNADAQLALGTMYFEGMGTAQDEGAAIDYLRRAAEGGQREAMFAAGRILLSKPELEAKTEGLALMNRAIENGHIEATLMLATAYGRGEKGLPKDEAKAEGLLKPAAERGNADCQIALASLYKFGDSFESQREEADVWLLRAAEQDHPKALEILGSQRQ